MDNLRKGNVEMNYINTKRGYLELQMHSQNHERVELRKDRGKEELSGGLAVSERPKSRDTVFWCEVS
jgi:hypothetical protein